MNGKNAKLFCEPAGLQIRPRPPATPHSPAAEQPVALRLKASVTELRKRRLKVVGDR